MQKRASDLSRLSEGVSNSLSSLERRAGSAAPASPSAPDIASRTILKPIRGRAAIFNGGGRGRGGPGVRDGGPGVRDPSSSAKGAGSADLRAHNPRRPAWGASAAPLGDPPISRTKQAGPLEKALAPISDQSLHDQLEELLKDLKVRGGRKWITRSCLGLCLE